MSKKYSLSFLISSVAFFLAFVLFYYMDLKSLTVWTVNIWDTLAETGNIRHFYEYSAMNLYQLDHAMVGSDIFIYLPWAIWNLPIWILQRFAGLAVIEHFWMVLYSKCFLLAVFALILYLARKIALLFTTEKEDIHRMLFLSATSFFTITSLAYIGQNDVLVIAPFLMGIYELLKGNRRKFLFWSAVSIAFKPFFVFSFLVLILLFEKNLLKDMLYFISGFGLLLLQKLLFHGAPAYAESLSYGPTSGAFGLLLKSVLDIPPVGASLFVLGWGILCLLAYFYDKKTPDKESVLYYSVAPLIVFFLFTRYEAYRPFYLVPLLYLLFLIRPAYAGINLLLETVATGSLLYFYLMDDVLFYNPNFMLTRGVKIEVPSLSAWFSTKLPGLGYQAFTAIFVLAMFLILLFNHPLFHSNNQVLKKEEEVWLLPLRSFIYAVPTGLALCFRIFF